MTEIKNIRYRDVDLPRPLVSMRLPATPHSDRRVMCWIAIASVLAGAAIAFVLAGMGIGVGL